MVNEVLRIFLSGYGYVYICGDWGDGGAGMEKGRDAQSLLDDESKLVFYGGEDVVCVCGY